MANQDNLLKNPLVENIIKHNFYVYLLFVVFTDVTAITEGWKMRNVQDIGRVAPAMVEVSGKYFDSCNCD